MNSQPELGPLPAEKPPLTNRALILGGNLAGFAMLAINPQIAEDIFSWVDDRQQQAQLAAQE